jgi:hypothetical protein
VAVYSAGIEAPFFRREGGLVLRFVKWEEILEIVPMRWGNPFEMHEGRTLAAVSGLYLVAGDGAFCLLYGGSRASRAIRGEVKLALGSRWADMYRGSEVVAISSNPKAPAGASIRERIQRMSDPTTVEPGALMATQPEASWHDARRQWLSRALRFGGFAWCGIGLGALILFFPGFLPEFVRRFAAPVLLLVGAALCAVAVVYTRRWLTLGHIEVFENGILLPSVWLASERQFVPYQFVTSARRERSRGRGVCFLVGTIPWLEPFLVPATLQAFEEAMAKNGISIVP